MALRRADAVQVSEVHRWRYTSCDDFQGRGVPGAGFVGRAEREVCCAFFLISVLHS